MYKLIFHMKIGININKVFGTIQNILKQGTGLVPCGLHGFDKPEYRLKIHPEQRCDEKKM